MDKGRMLLIDDVRNFNVDAIARTYDEGKRQLLLGGPWDVVYLDHDLGDRGSWSEDHRRHMTGLDILNWLEGEKHLLPKKLTVVTDNAAARAKMEDIVKRLYSA